MEIIDSIPALKTVNADSLQILQKQLEQALARNESSTNNLSLLLCTGLVFIMTMGFACMESGLIRAKNTTNVLFKNILIPVIAILTFSSWAFVVQIPGIKIPGDLIEINQWGFWPLRSLDAEMTGDRFDFWTFFLFQTMVASVACAIIVGAVVERIKFISFLIFSFLFIGIIYPLIRIENALWLSSLKFYDFAGSSLVHMVGGCAALVGASMLGPRIGKYAEGRILPIPGHNMSLASIGLFILWFGCIGFNGGAALLTKEQNFSYVLITTFISAASGCLGAFCTSYFANKTHDITMSMNGILAGLVAITASANIMSLPEAFIIGLVSGILVVFSVLLFDKLKIDDPVGAVSVHLVCGIWGTMAVGIFGPFAGKDQFVAQLIGCLVVIATVYLLSFVIFLLLRKTKGLRISEKNELQGIDITSHGMRAYNLDPEND
jgi:Amt family ammonium transporter